MVEAAEQGPPLEVTRRFPWPVQLTTNPVTGTVGTSSTLVLRHNPRRVFWYIENRSLSVMYQAWDNEVSSTLGSLMDADGGFKSMTWDEDQEAVFMPVFLVAAAASSAVWVVEIERAS